MQKKNGTWLTRRVFVVAGILLVSGLAAWTQLVLNVSSAATLDDGTLEVKALDWARSYGLEGTPSAKRSSRMSMGEWLALSGAGGLGDDAKQLGLGPDTPVYVLAILGKVQWRSPGALPQGDGSQSFAESFDNITVVVDARNGNGLWAKANRSAFSMPIQVPLNALTPTVPVISVPTQAPRVPPTLPKAPAVTPTLKPYP